VPIFQDLREKTICQVYNRDAATTMSIRDVQFSTLQPTAIAAGYDSGIVQVNRSNLWWWMLLAYFSSVFDELHVVTSLDSKFFVVPSVFYSATSCGFRNV
jgi:hypothetical protein